MVQLSNKALRQLLHELMAGFLFVYAGWTLAVHASTLLGASLFFLAFLAPVLIGAMWAGYRYASRDVSSSKVIMLPQWADTGESQRITDWRLSISLVLLVLSPWLLWFSWRAFWGVVLLIALLSLWRRDDLGAGAVFGFSGGCCSDREDEPGGALPGSAKPLVSGGVIGLMMLLMVVLAYAVNRSDMDDAFYVAVAAFTAANPHAALLGADPMLGQPDFPLIFESYRFVAFEVLAGALAYMLSIPSMTVYYVALLPLWVMAFVVAVYLLCSELTDRGWIRMGTIALVLILLLGEMHRSPGNFSVVRLYQGKAVFLWVVVPCIFYLTSRYLSPRGGCGDLFLLGCCQVVAIGLSNFGMLMGPLAAFGALLSHWPALNGREGRGWAALAVLCLPAPYLLRVLWTSQGSPLREMVHELPADVWLSVFGEHQQYLLAMLMLAGPVLAPSIRQRWQLAVPIALLFAVYLNPWLSAFISQYVTTPAVYWRVIWSFPVLVFAAAGAYWLCYRLGSGVRSDRTLGVKGRVWTNSMFGHFAGSSSLCAVALGVVLLLEVIVAAVHASPFHVLRTGNHTLAYTGFAQWKVSEQDLAVARRAIALTSESIEMQVAHLTQERLPVKRGGLLAPEAISGLVSRFEQHPGLVNTRDFYLDLIRPMIGDDRYWPRRVAFNFVSGLPSGSVDEVSVALSRLDLQVIVMPEVLNDQKTQATLAVHGYQQQERLHGYVFWVKGGAEGK